MITQSDLSISRLPHQENVCWVLLPLYLESFLTLGVLNVPCPPTPTCIYMYVCILYILASHTFTSTEFWAKWAPVKSISLPRGARSVETQRQDNRSYRCTPHGCQGWGSCGSAQSTLFVACVFLLLCLIQLNSWLLESDWCPVWIHFREHKNEDDCWGWEQKKLETSEHEYSLCCPKDISWVATSQASQWASCFITSDHSVCMEWVRRKAKAEDLLETSFMLDWMLYVHYFLQSAHHFLEIAAVTLVW